MRYFRAANPYWAKLDGEAVKAVYPVIETRDGWEQVFALAPSAESQREIVDAMTFAVLDEIEIEDCDNGGCDEDFDDWDWGDAAMPSSIPKFAEDFVFEGGDRP